MRADGPSDHRTQTQLVCKRTCEAVRSVDIRRSQFPMALDGGRKLLTTLWIPTVNINVFARYRCKLPADRERDHRVVDSRLGNLQLVRGCTGDVIDRRVGLSTPCGSQGDKWKSIYGPPRVGKW